MRETNAAVAVGRRTHRRTKPHAKLPGRVVSSKIDLTKATGRPYRGIEEMYEWDAEKAAANLRNHGVAFHEAVLASATHSASNGSTIARTMVKNVSVCLACAMARFST